MSRKLFFRLALAASVLAFCVVVLGAYVRLSNAGLGCPDWPGCYGHIGVPESHNAVSQAGQAFPDRPVEPAKAWKEMVHRYFAGTLGLLILALAVIAWRRRHEPNQPVKLPLFLVLLVIFQAVLGMWTVTWLLKPLVVTGHLIGGMTTFALLWLTTLRSGDVFAWLPRPRPALRRFALFALIVLACQIMLGGWTSTNYAALACPDFPTCQLQWWPNMDFHAGFTLWHGLGIDYEGGILNGPARTAIHFTHRIGALITFLTLLTLAVWLFLGRQPRVLRALGGILAIALMLQVSLGISVVEFGLPLPVAVAHNAGAALLLGTMVTVMYALWRRRST